MVWLRLAHAWVLWTVMSLFEDEPLDRPTRENIR